MQRKTLYPFLFVSIVGVSACGDGNHRMVQGYQNLPAVNETDGKIRHSKKTGDNPADIRQALYDFYQKWKRVRYRLGGNSKRGIDCSRFVYRAYQDKFGITLPKNTYEQHSYGHRVPLNQLRPGDLLFFRTDFYGNHVGIYLKGGKFMHAATKEGVTISYLDEDYWQKKFWKAKRIIGR